MKKVLQKIRIVAMSAFAICSMLLMSGCILDGVTPQLAVSVGDGGLATVTVSVSGLNRKNVDGDENPDWELNEVYCLYAVTDTEKAALGKIYAGQSNVVNQAPVTNYLSTYPSRVIKHSVDAAEVAAFKNQNLTQATSWSCTFSDFLDVAANGKEVQFIALFYGKDQKDNMGGYITGYYASDIVTKTVSFGSVGAHTHNTADLESYVIKAGWQKDGRRTKRCPICGYVESSAGNTSEIIYGVSKISIPQEKYNYTGEPIKPEVTVISTYSDTYQLAEGTHYKVEYVNNVKVGTAAVVITGIGEYEFSKQIGFQIVEEGGGNGSGVTIGGDPVTSGDIISVTLVQDSYTYTGHQIQPQITVLGTNNVTLIEGADYEVTYANNINVSNTKKASVTVKGKGNFSGTRTAEFTITKAEILSASLWKSVFEYNGKSQSLSATVIGSDGKTLRQNTDYMLNPSSTMIAPGNNYKATLTGNGNYAGTWELEYTVLPAQLGEVTLEKDSYQYTGSAIKPKVTVKNAAGTQTLTENTDYTVAYKNNTEAGTATVTVTGKGFYTGEVILEFLIYTDDKYVVDTITLANATNIVYDGSAKTPEVTVRNKKGETLRKGTDYSVTYTNNVNAGTATATVTGIDPYKFKSNIDFPIKPKSVSSLTLTLAETTYKYTSNPITPEVTVTYGSQLLVKDRDYTVSYENNIYPSGSVTGQPTVIVKKVDGGNYNFSDQKKNFTILATNAATLETVTLSETGYTYDGTAKEPAVTVKDSKDVTLVKDTDYTVKYSNNTNAGEATVTVTGKGSYEGATKTATFTIAPAALGTAALAETSCVYSGNANTPGVTVKNSDGTTNLLNNTDYTVAYANNINVGEATVTVSGKGNYTGKKELTFTITAAELGSATMSQTAYGYTGSEITPSVTVKNKANKVLTAGTDYTVSYKNNKEVGTASVTVTGKGNYTGTKELTFTITAPTITSVVIPKDDYTYDGTEKKPTVTVTDSTNRTLTLGTHYSVDYSNNINAGEATVTVTGLGDFKNFTQKLTFTISPANVTEAVLAPGSYTYDGKAKEPAVTVKGSDKNTLKATDYTVVYADNVNAGKATVTITGKGNYAGTLQMTFTISPAAIDVANLTVTQYDYTGSAITPAVAVTDGSGKALTKDTDYTIAYTNNTNVGTAKITVEGIGNYSGSCEMTFIIKAIPIQVADLEVISYGYTGSAITPAVAVTNKAGTALVAGTDYEITYADNVAVGKASMTVTGKGNYTGTVTLQFIITEATIETVELSQDSYTYDGAAKKPGVTVTDTTGKTLKSGTDYTVAYSNNTNAGTAVVTVTGIGNYSGSLTKEFAIEAAALAEATLAKTSYTYTGAAITPAVTVKNASGAVLTEKTDYTVAYSDHTDVGEATVTVTAQGNYRGTATLHFTIAPAAIQSATLSQSSYTADGTAKEPGVTVTGSNGATLKEGTDYTVAYANNTEPGEATVTVTGKGNYSGTKTLHFTITEKPTIAEVTLSATSYTYDGSAKEPGVTVKDSEGATLKKDTDYTVTYHNNVNAGTGKVTVTGAGNYTGSVTKEFTIKAVAIADATLARTSYDYTGAAFTPGAIVKNSAGSILTENVDYTVAYADNVNAGKASVTVTGKGNYSGSKKLQFTISPAAIQTVTLSQNTYTYDGSAKEPAVTVTGRNGAVLTAGADYTVTYADNTGKSDATVTASATVTGKGNYTGTKTVKFTITEKPTIETVALSESNYVYDGKAKEPVAIVTDTAGKTLEKDTDYTVSYSNNINAGTGKVTVSGKGNYAGTKTQEFTIEAAQIAEAVLANTTYSYTGSAILPGVTVTNAAGTTLTANTDYTVSYGNNTDAGEATVTVTGKGNYTGRKSVAFTISPAPLESAELSQSSYTYDGSAKEPAVTVKGSKGKVLTEGTDYTVAYANNKEVGNATVTVTGIGNYTGTKTARFTITQEPTIGKVTLDKTSYTYDGSAKEPTVTVKDATGQTTLKKDTDYTVSYSDNTDVGTGRVTVTGIGSYKGTATKEFTIKAAQLAKATLEKNSYVYTGSAITPAVTVTNAGGTVLTRGTDYTLTYSDNIDAGTGKVTVTGKGNYTGTKTQQFTITKVRIKEAALSQDIYTYDGTAKEPGVTVTGNNNKVLSEGTDYTVTYANNIGKSDAAVTASATVTGKGNYSGSVTLTFTITVNPTIETVTLSQRSYTYDGTAKEPAVTVKDSNGNELKAGTDYTLTYADNIEVGEATVTVTGKGKYDGTKTESFTIKAAAIAGVMLEKTNYVYTGAAMKPGVTVTDAGGAVLTRGTDYVVTYSDNTEAGTGKVTVTGKGNYTGTQTQTFTIAPARIAEAELSQSTYTYDGEPKEPGVTVKDSKGKVLRESTDYTVAYIDNTQEGEATVTVTGKGNYTGRLTLTFTITVNPTIETVTLSAKRYTYDGSAKEPGVTVKDNKGKVLEKDTDYTVSYGGDNVNAGTATVTVAGAGSYTGEVTLEFTIAPAVISHASLSEETKYVYSAQAVTPEVIVTSGEDVALVKDTDYTLTYSDNTDAGTGKVTVAGKGNYTGMKTLQFTILPAQIESATLSQDAYTYDGNAKEPAVTVKDDKGNVLAEDVDYTVAYADNTEVGNATVTVTGKDNYAGEKKLSFTITDQPTIATLTLSQKNYVYDGNAKEPAVTVKDNKGKTLTKGTDYEVTYSDHVNAGTASVKVTGAGDYTGSKTQTFSIKAAAVSDVILEGESSYPYTGAQIRPQVTVTNSAGSPLEENVDYTVTYSDNVDAGTGKVTVAGKGNYGGVKTQKFTIAPAEIANVALSQESYVYSGEAKEPVVRVTDQNGAVLTEIEDYTVAYSSNVNAGSAQVSVTGRGNYTGTLDAGFTIAPADFSGVVAVLSQDAYKYTGAPITPEVTATDRAGVTLTQGVDYQVEYAENREPGTAKVTLTGMGNYTGTKELTFTINVAEIEQVVLSVSEYTYDGTRKCPSVTITDYNGKVLEENTDYTLSYTNNINAGTAKVTIKYIGDYVFVGEQTKTYKIAPAFAVTVNLEKDRFPYTGSAITPAVIVKTSSEKTLSAGTDYTVKYEDNVQVGMAKVTVTGKGNYDFTKILNFYIEKKDTTGEPAQDDPAQSDPNQGDPGQNNPTQDDPGQTDPGQDDPGQTDPGEDDPGQDDPGQDDPSLDPPVLVQKLGSIKLSATTAVYTGKAIKPAVTVKNQAGKVLKKDTDYKVAYKNNTKCGKATVTVTGKGKYRGTLKKTFVIVPGKGEITKLKVGAKSLKVTVKSQKKSGISGYEISYRVAGTKTWKTKTLAAKNTSLTLKALKKGKKVEVRVRAYVKVGSSKKYGDYSKVKTSGKIK